MSDKTFQVIVNFAGSEPIVFTLKDRPQLEDYRHQIFGIVGKHNTLTIIDPKTGNEYLINGMKITYITVVC